MSKEKRSKIRIGVIGGSGLYQIEGLKEVVTRSVSTPYGSPSDDFICGVLEGAPVAFLPRHGRGHTILPSEINFRANIYAFKKIGVEQIISVSAVGSMKEKIEPGDFLVPDQFFDRTQNRKSTYFGGGVAAHVAMAQPVCPHLSDLLFSIASKSGKRVHRGGTYLCIEGPQFSTQGESRVYRSWGVDVIGMTNLPEARLAREAEICYASLALVTDYDCWNENEVSVTTEMVIQRLLENVAAAKKILGGLIPRIPKERDCVCGHALEGAIVTDLKKAPRKAKKGLEWLLKGRFQ
ncbi:MAG: S-methyl-5'-thioadenosine phosphorylase [Deltaproteobacteria bacterium]|nr:S-methyl-5'-thioadenosine phosphorylase [Deltaproteobacteria bacterium]